MGQTARSVPDTSSDPRQTRENPTSALPHAVVASMPRFAGVPPGFSDAQKTTSNCLWPAASCTIVALATVSCRRRFPGCSDLPWRPMRAHRERRLRPDGACERGAAAGSVDGVAPLSRMEEHARAGGSRHARATVRGRWSRGWAPSWWSGPGPAAGASTRRAALIPHPRASGGAGPGTR